MTCKITKLIIADNCEWIIQYKRNDGKLCYCSGNTFPKYGTESGPYLGPLPGKPTDLNLYYYNDEIKQQLIDDAINEFMLRKAYIPPVPIPEKTEEERPRASFLKQLFGGQNNK